MVVDFQVNIRSWKKHAEIKPSSPLWRLSSYSQWNNKQSLHFSWPGGPPRKKQKTFTKSNWTSGPGMGRLPPYKSPSDFRGESLKGTGTISECQEAIRLRARLLARHAQWTLVSTLAGFFNKEKGPLVVQGRGWIPTQLCGDYNKPL